MSECVHEWRGAAHPILWECDKCHALTIIVPGNEEVAAMLKRIREEELGKERSDEFYAEAEAIIRGEMPMPRTDPIVIEGTLAR